MKIDKCQKQGCNPQLVKRLCCDLEYDIRCWCGEESNYRTDKESAIRFWNKDINDDK